MSNLLEGVNLPKIVAILAVIFGISLGMCGLNVLAVSAFSRGNGGPAQLLIATAWLELFVMIISGLGLIMALILWGVDSLFSKGPKRNPDIQRLFDDNDQGDKPAAK
jgi:hypothetical protein